MKLPLIILLILSCISSDAQPNTDSLIIEGLAIEFVLVKGGSFVMGSNELNEEYPAHTVTVRSFYMSKYEVTQRIWDVVMGYNESSHENCNDCPVENVTWDAAQQFISKLSKISGKRLRLPTEAEWEFAAAGGIYSKHYKYAGSNDADAVAWYYGNSGRTTHPVGRKKPNELGLYDMSGNVAEWCSDWWDYNYYKHSPSNNPPGAATGTKKVVRGGSYGSTVTTVRVKDRSVYGVEPNLVGSYYGFRLVRDCQ